jgi:hypothetical protein
LLAEPWAGSLIANSSRIYFGNLMPPIEAVASQGLHLFQKPTGAAQLAGPLLGLWESDSYELGQKCAVDAVDR